MPPVPGSTVEEWMNYFLNTVAAEEIVSVTNVSAQILPANPRRICLVFSTITASRITINFGKVAVDAQGFIFAANQLWQPIHIWDIGQTITREVNAIANVVGPIRIAMYEVLRMP